MPMFVLSHAHRAQECAISDIRWQQRKRGVLVGGLAGHQTLWPPLAQASAQPVLAVASLASRASRPATAHGEVPGLCTIYVAAASMKPMLKREAAERKWCARVSSPVMRARLSRLRTRNQSPSV